ncbi:hypothetical protein EGH21_14400 [Halomicroarcula sp. F13]|uniref:Uncharacterized protein n=1 Tax=Haloarcula rubra TaxID=2487747 RepID=A0AAW4PUD0_9EURY|nr:hypothetical protein [Halomicroarcula rubra]MBX0324226.1 hypothetical protein [Halomicroarcula rubra]
MDWVERAGDLLYDGESIREHVRVGDGGVVVTSHRLLAFTPDRDGPNFRQVDRPNVEGVDRRSAGNADFLEQGVKALVAGVVLVVAGQMVSLDGLVAGVSLDGVGSAGAMGLGGMLGLLQGLLRLLAQLDDIMTLFGGLALALAAVVLGVYLWSREAVLVVSVAGGDDVELSAPEDDTVLERIRAAVRPDGPSSAASEPPVTDDPLA